MRHHAYLPPAAQVRVPHFGLGVLGQDEFAGTDDYGVSANGGGGGDGGAGGGYDGTAAGADGSAPPDYSGDAGPPADGIPIDVGPMQGPSEADIVSGFAQSGDEAALQAMADGGDPAEIQQLRTAGANDDDIGAYGRGEISFGELLSTLQSGASFGEPTAPGGGSQQRSSPSSGGGSGGATGGGKGGGAPAPRTPTPKQQRPLQSAAPTVGTKTWFEGQAIPGLPNTLLLVGGVLAFVILARGKK